MVYVKALFVIVTIAIISFYFGYILARARWSKRIPKKTFWEGHQDVADLIDEGMLRIAGAAPPKLTLLNTSSKHISLGSMGLQIAPGEKVQVDRPQ